MPYIGTQPQDTRSFARSIFEYTATQGQTAFTGADDNSKTLGFTGREFQVFVNGVLMDDSDFTATNNNTITLASAANLNDVVTIIVVAKDIPIADFVPSGGDGTFTGSITNSGKVKGTGVGMFRRNDQTLSTNVTILGTENSVVGGPITVASGVTLTVATGGNFSVV